MLSARWRRVALAVLACLLAACGSDDDDGSGGLQPGPGPVPGPGGGVSAPEPAVCGNADLSALQTRVHVSPQGSDDPGCGQTSAAACKSIQQGIANCAASGCGVLVRHGLYPASATIQLRDAVSVYGGCLFDGEPARGYRSVLLGPPGGQPVIVAERIVSPTTLHGVMAVASDAQAAGAPSIAMTASSSSDKFVLAQTTLVAGRGAAGARGADAAAAATGDNGGPAPAPSNYDGGQGGQGACPGTVGFGGSGGVGGVRWIGPGSSCDGATCTCVDSPDSRPAAQGEGAGAASGGALGSAGGEGCICGNTHPAGDGGPGHKGDDGACAAQGGIANASIAGSLDAVSWKPSSGGNGAAGGGGAGGGGGGGGGYGADAWGGKVYDGGGGGGGGGGGCGGNAGGGGQQGGASIGLVLYASPITWSQAGSSVVPGPGGQGGVGGSGGAGGTGGSGGAGWQSSKVDLCLLSKAVPGQGAAGGPGGRGGAGSGGAGGSGGPSIGIALRAASSAPAAAIIYPAPPGGAGGSGGGGGRNAPIPNVDPNPCAASDGQSGLQGGSAGVMDFDLPLDSMLLPGQQLPNSYAIHSPNGQVRLVMQDDGNLCLYDSRIPVGALWCSHTNPRKIPAAVMQTDGNLCMYAAGAAVWCSGTEGFPGAHLMVQDSGHVQLIAADMSLLWMMP